MFFTVEVYAGIRIALRVQTIGEGPADAGPSSLRWRVEMRYLASDDPHRPDVLADLQVGHADRRVRADRAHDGLHDLPRPHHERDPDLRGLGRAVARTTRYRLPFLKTSRADASFRAAAFATGFFAAGAATAGTGVPARLTTVAAVAAVPPRDGRLLTAAAATAASRRRGRERPDRAHWCSRSSGRPWAEDRCSSCSGCSDPAGCRIRRYASRRSLRSR